MFSKMKYILVAAVLALATTAMAEDIMVGDFEDGLDGWYEDNGTLTLGATGATSGAQAMQVDAPGGWNVDAKLDVKAHLAALGMQGAKITADITAFEADMTTEWMQVEMVINAQNNDDNGANNNIGWNPLGGQDIMRDGEPHTYTWELPDTLTAQIAGADDTILWFEIALVSNVDGASIAKFYIDNIQVSYDAPTTSVVVGDFEDGLDGWYEDNGTLTLGATGATSGAQALQVDAPGGWNVDAKLDVKAHLAALGMQGAKITADITAFEADMTTEWMQVEMVINAQNNDDNGANNNIGWNPLGGQDIMRDGEPHTYTWELPDTLTAQIAGADDTILWFEIALVSNVDGASIAKFYIDNIQILAPAASGKSTDFILGNFEEELDGWEVTGGADALFSDTNGVTLDDYSLDIYTETGEWAAVLTMNLLEPNNADALEAFRTNTEISADITHLVADWPVDDIPPWNGTHLIINTNGEAVPSLDSGYVNLGYRAGWSQNDGDRTDSVTWDYSQAINDINANFDKVTYLELQIIVNANSPEYEGWVWFYLDNMRLTGGGVPLDPQPADGAKDVNVETALSWTSGMFAATHELYLGTSRDAVLTAEGDSDPTNVLFVPLDLTTFDPNELAFNTQYFWKVVEVNDVNPDSPWESPVWEFTTGNFVVVDDFESYTDDLDTGAVFLTWIDGFDDETNGSQIGYLDPPFMEQAIFHGDSGQSAPFTYNNTEASRSEIARTWDGPQDWTADGFSVLKLYVYGLANNGADPLYVTVEDAAGISATVAYGDPTVLQKEEWTEWTIPLTEFVDVDLTAVTMVTLGVGSEGAPSGSIGTIYIDDIRIAPQPLGLVAYYPLEGNLEDNSGNGFDGTFGGDPNFPAEFIAGPAGFGQALQFDGTGGHQCVEVGTFNPSAATGQLSVALWAKWDGLSDQWQGLIGKRDSWAVDDMMWHLEIGRDNGNIGFARRDSYPSSGGAQLPTGEWTHVAVTYDGTTARFYVNGEETGSGDFAFGTDREAMVVIGADNPGGGNAFNGALDEVRLYDTVLTPSQIGELMAN